MGAYGIHRCIQKYSRVLGHLCGYMGYIGITMGNSMQKKSEKSMKFGVFTAFIGIDCRGGSNWNRVSGMLYCSNYEAIHSAATTTTLLGPSERPVNPKSKPNP